MAFQRHVTELLENNGEYVDVRALTRRAPGCATAARTPRQSPPTARTRRHDLVAGWWMVDVESRERAIELAAYVSAEPGPGGERLYE